ncbi:TPA: glycosyltransferase family 2 protein [Burkholderia multivorans]|uniref:glycosyltransferase family 2 protein n=1 Tax=Burkholderia multivorans TaxID=87883 RepID=UPI000CFEF019|nr:glycosyltransferase family 2 protein [Burkholderia multivorans]MCL4628939.1 glycosyltransferase family 2 protein [Burkholderia multivorans]PRG94469.1 glycosyl transferase [Burkholderia multivorans]HEF4775917.1 glycosyltransferase family 2 protein [Burkholderia multivorans]HEF4824590.1 glycosyltransferase family 2 protein [Burkholderia multivorans]
MTISVVTFRPDPTLLARTLSSVEAACDAFAHSSSEPVVKVFLIDNGGEATTLAEIRNGLGTAEVDYRTLTGHGNVGYGRGHNLAISAVDSTYHLILNPDIDVETDALVRALDFLDAHPEVGLVTPWIGDDNGHTQHLCRRFPALLDLLVRGFLPARMRGWFAGRLAHYEMRDVINDHDIVWDPPIVSGCFMLFRTEVLKKLGGFDPRYFLYFEDYDLSLRTHDVARVAYVPSVRVIHHGGGASRKGFAHIRMFAASAFKFYNRFGWRLW